MASSFDVADSTDWLATPLAGLAAVEAALRCQMCKDFFRTPMITSCSHTFCSICIRHALGNDGRCPLCRNQEQEYKLRNNWAMDEAVEAFSKSRKDVLAFARKPPPAAPPLPPKAQSPKRKLADRTDSAPEPETKRLRSSARLRSAASQEQTPNPAEQAPEEVVQIPDSADEMDGDDGDGYDAADGEYQDQEETKSGPNDGLVPCPMCQSRMKDWQVFKHLDTCPGPSAGLKTNGESSKAPQEQQPASSSSFRNQQPIHSQANRPSRLPPLSYSLLNDKVLRKKLTDLGLSSQGNRQLLERRHKEWTTIWNANCDAARPKQRSELLHELRVWEETQGGGGGKGAGGMASFTGLRKAAPPIEVKNKDFDGAAWGEQHNASFKDLIANARKNRTQTADKEQGKQGANEEEKKTEVDGEENQPPPPLPTVPVTDGAEAAVAPPEAEVSSSFAEKQQDDISQTVDMPDAVDAS